MIPLVGKTWKFSMFYRYMQAKFLIKCGKFREHASEIFKNIHVNFYRILEKSKKCYDILRSIPGNSQNFTKNSKGQFKLLLDTLVEKDYVEDSCKRLAKSRKVMQFLQVSYKNRARNRSILHESR